MLPCKRRNRDQQSEQSAGEQQPSLEQAQSAAEKLAVQVLVCPPTD